MACRSVGWHAPPETRAPVVPRRSSVSTGYARENIRVVAVIQARMGSTRLPGKVLKPIAGQPLLWHIVHRLKKCHLLEDIAVATTVNPADEAIVEWCNAN